MRKAALFVNPLLCSKPRHRASVSAVASVLEQAGVRVTIQELGAIPEAAGLAREAIAAGCDTLLSCGGDGTVFALLQALAGSGVPLGIIPMGTGNVLAHNIRLPRNPVAAAQALLRSTPREIPLGRLTSVLPGEASESSWYFAMSAGMGAHAMLMQTAERWGKHLSGRAAYYFAGFDLLSRHEIESFEIEVTTAAGQTFTQLASEALVVRVAELNRWRPGGDLERPLLRLAVVNATTRWQMARASFAALARPARLSAITSELTRGEAGDLGTGGQRGSHSAHYFDVSRVVCRPRPGHEDRASPLLQADGEVLGASNAVITLAEETLTLLWPETPS